MKLLNLKKKRLALVIFTLVLGCELGYGQILISLLFGDKLNSGKVEFGLDGGLALSNISGIDNSSVASSMNLGFYFDIKTKKENVFVHTGVIVKSAMGAEGVVYTPQNNEVDVLFTGVTGRRKLNYFNVPVFVKYRFYDFFNVEIGPQLGLLYKAKDEFSTTEEDQEITVKTDVKEQYKLFDLGVGIGLGYKLLKGTGINLGVRYYQGLLNIAKDTNDNNQQFNHTFYVYAGIPIGAGKNKSRE